MRPARHLALSAVSAGLLSLGLATAALAVSPQGKGLPTVADLGVTNVVCPGLPGITAQDVRSPGGGAANFVAGGRLYVTAWISVTGTATTPDGTFPIQFQKSWGGRAGLTERVTCTFQQSFTEDGALISVTGTIELARVQ